MEPTMMPSGRYNDLPGDTVILTAEDYARSFRTYEGETLPSAGGDYNAIVLVSQIGSYPPGTRLAVFTSSTGVKYWAPVGGGAKGVSAPYNVRAHQLADSQTVLLRWCDPADSATERWKYTRVLRKLGGYPTNYRDGVVVVDNQVRDYYADKVLTDVLPPDITGTWYYRIFAVSDNDIVSTDKNCVFVPIALDWKNISTYIQQGKAPSMLGVGDVIVLSNPDGSIYDNLELVVAGFDQVTPVESKFRHSITLITRQLLTQLPYDTGWGRYKLVEDEVVIAGVKIYYQKTADGLSYKACRPQPPGGYHITKEDGYYYQVSDTLANYGQNRWKECKLREWTNASSSYAYTRTTDDTWVASKTYAKLNENGTYTVVTSSMMDGTPADNRLYERGDKIKFFSGKADEQYEPPMEALQRIHPDFANLVIQCVNTTALTEDLRAGGEYQSETTTDRVWVPSRTEITGSSNEDVKEGVQIQFFADDVANRARTLLGTVDNKAWWTRSPEVYNDIVTKESSRQTVKTIGTPDEVGSTCPVVNTSIVHGPSDPSVTRGVCLMFAIA